MFGWKAPTWKGLIGLLALASSVVTALTVSNTTLPHNYEVALGLIGGVLLAVERWADAMDNQTANGGGGTTTVVPGGTTPANAITGPWTITVNMTPGAPAATATAQAPAAPPPG